MLSEVLALFVNGLLQILIVAAVLVLFYAMWRIDGEVIPKHDPYKEVKAYTTETRVPPNYTYVCWRTLCFFRSVLL